MKHETRDFNIELRAASDDPMKFEGMAVVFNKLSEPGVGAPGGEIINPNALNKTLNEQRDIFLLNGHNWTQPLASTGSGTLELRATTDGLRVSGSFVDTTYARDASALVAAGVVTSMSMGFQAVRQRMELRELPSGQRANVRILDEIRMSEVSIVARPAYKGTSAEMRSLDELACLLDEIRAGRVLSDANSRTIQAAIAQLEALLASANASAIAGGTDGPADACDCTDPQMCAAGACACCNSGDCTSACCETPNASALSKATSIRSYTVSEARNILELRKRR
jgi:HK97 family phage prohead protease